MTKNIVLAHGILGFGDLGIGIESQYFRRVADHFRDAGHTVLVPTVPPLATLAARAKELSIALQAEGWAEKQDLIVLAHSMGGLDIRRVVFEKPEIARRVKSIITIATPHLGSPVADAVLSTTDPLRELIPPFLLSLLERHTGAIADLKTRLTLHDPDVPGIKYFEIGCVAGDSFGSSPFFELSQKIGHLQGSNDGVVSLMSSKSPSRPLAQIWDADHGEAIGWPTGTLGLSVALGLSNFLQKHLARYDSLLALAEDKQKISDNI